MCSKTRKLCHAILVPIILLLVSVHVVAAAPSITSLSPTSGAVGASVTIAGSGFGSTQGSSTVKFNGTTATVTSWGASSIAVTVPSGATTGNVVVTVSGAASNGKSFTVLPTPSITSLSLNTGAVGAAVTIAGSNLGSSQGSGTVKFNGTTATVTSWSASSIAVTVPSGATTGNVVVNASGVNTNGIAFTVVPAPSISSLTPTSGAVGASVTIAGSNFGATQGSSTVKFNGTTATATSWSASSIVAVVPSGATTGNVVVHASGVDSGGKSFTVVSAPSITSLSVTSGGVGSAVTITGTNFGSTQGTSTVQFNGTSASVSSWSATSIHVTVPVGATTGNVVVHASGVDSNGKPFTVLATPAITNLNPASGMVGDDVVITGTNFGAAQGTSTVKFNGTTATPINWSDTSIETTVPSGASSGNVVVTVSGVASSGTNFIVYVTPTISSLSPNNGAVGTLVTINGTGFQATQMDSTVTFNGTAATSTSWTTTQIRAPVPSGATTGGVVVTVGGLVSNAMTFTVQPTPTITSVSNMYGAIGVSITIYGTNFGNSKGSSTVKFNGTTATPTSWNSSQIVTPVPSGATTGSLVVHINGVDVNAGNFSVVTIVSVAVAPANLTLPINSWQRFQAIATNSDGSTQDIALNATWSSSNTTVGTIDTTGVLDGLSEGQTTVQAIFGSFTGSTTLTIKGRSFVPVGSLNQVRMGHTATLLANGQVLIAGGYGGYPNSGNDDVLSSVEIYDPASKTFSFTGGLATARELHTATTLQNGKVLIVGGATPIGGGYTQETASAEIYDPSTGLFAPTGSLTTPRYGHTATLLPNGRVLVAGGYQNETQNSVQTVELYDPTTGTFTTTGSLSVPRGGAPATLLNDGTVLIAGGVNSFSLWASSDLYNPSTGLFSAGASLPIPQYNHSATLLNAGTVLLAGGTTTWMGPPWTNAMIYNPPTSSFIPVASLALARQSQTATILNDGTVLLVGGDSNYGTAELYNPTTQMFLGAGATEIQREEHTATLLNDGTVLIVGGTTGDGTAELYEPGLPAPLSVQISPASVNMVDGGTQQFVALDELGQQRTDATWTVSDTTVATLQSTFSPLLTAVAPGQITLTADVDGVVAQAQVTVAPVSLQITPASATMLIGNSRQFTVVDERGRSSAIATWTVSDPNLASITTDSSPTFTALGSGQVTLTANVEGVTNQAQVTISTAASFPPGTSLWSVPPLPGFNPQAILQAMPADYAPDFYSIQTSTDSSQTSVQAFTSDGQQVWQNVLGRPYGGTALPDGLGGLIVIGACDTESSTPMTIADLNRMTGGVNWQLAFPLIENGTPICIAGTPKLAVRQDGAVAVAMPESLSPAFYVLDGTGSEIAAPTIPPSTITDEFGDVVSCDCFSPVGQPIFDPDGSIYVEYEVRQIPYPSTTISAAIWLLKIAEDGSTSTVELSSSSSANLFPGTITPDGQGGVLATWTIANISPPDAPQPYQAAYVTGGAVVAAYPLPMAPTNVVKGPDGVPLTYPILLGENGTAYASYSANLVSFSVSSGSVLWNYQAAPQDAVSVIGATNDGGIVAEELTAGAGTLLSFNPQGGSSVVATVQGNVENSWSGGWYSLSNGTASQIALPPIHWAISYAAMVGGNPSRSSEFIGVAEPVEGTDVFGLSSPSPSCTLPDKVEDRQKVALAGDALTTYNNAKQALRNSGSLTCSTCSSFFNGDPTRATYFGQLTSGVTNQVPYDGAQTNISQYDAGLSDGKNPVDVRIKKKIPVCGLFVSFHGPNGQVKPHGITTAASQITPPPGVSATDVYINPDPKVLTNLTQATILHEVLHNLTGLEDFVPSDWRQEFGFQPPYDLKTLLGIETTPGVDPDPNGSTTDITRKLVDNGCAANN